MRGLGRLVLRIDKVKKQNLYSMLSEYFTFVRGGKNSNTYFAL